MSFWEKPQICNKENNGIIQDIKFPLSYQLSLSKKCEEKASQPPCKVYSTTPTSDVAKEDNRREVPSWEYTQGLQDIWFHDEWTLGEISSIIWCNRHHVLKSTFPEIRVATPDFLCCIFSWYISVYFLPFCFQPSCVFLFKLHFL